MSATETPVLDADGVVLPGDGRSPGRDAAGPPVFRRPPREYPAPPEAEAEVEVGAPPTAPRPPSSSAVMFLLPVLGTVAAMAVAVLAVRGAQATYMLIAIPVMLVSYLGGVYNYVHERERFRREGAHRTTVFTGHLAERRRDIEALHAQQRDASLLPNPSPEECLERAARRARRLWERSPGDRDALDLRLGVGSVPVCFTIRPPSRPEVAMAPDPLADEAQAMVRELARVEGCAVVLPVRQAGAIGFAGSRASLQGLLRALLVQLATHHAPDEVKLVLFVPAAETDQWSWARWLPHTWNADRSHRFVAASPASVRRVLAEVADEIRQRQLQRQAATGKEPPPPVPAYVIVFADPGLVHGPDAALGPLLQALLTEGPALSAFGLFLTDRPEQVPKGCGAVVDLTEPVACLRVGGAAASKTVFAPDDVDAATADRFSRSLAPLRAGTLGAAADLPPVVTLLDVLGSGTVDALPTLERWQRSEPFRSLAVPIGVRGGGEVLSLDIHERGHGPHGLMAGTTGAGKSELLQTLIASLAAHFHPHELAFVLIDYKGGGMANAFLALPHQVGIITNLGGNLTTRALSALRAELKRRQRLFNEVGVDRIDHYQVRHRDGRAGEPLPHLVIVADEFAELKQNQPEFMSELIGVARVGRSLGVHLLLATQKPAGVVNDQIWSNSNFRVCLRVQARDDSMEMLKRPDAASIPSEQRGRAFLQVGMNEVFELFQAAYAGALYQPDDATGIGRTDVFEVALDGTRRRLSPAADRPRVGADGRTQLDALVSNLANLARDHGIVRLPGFWLPPLPDAVRLGDLRDPGIRSGWDGETWLPTGEWMAPVVGLVDDPATLNQAALRLPLGGEGHLAVYGAPGVGKTTLAQTMILSLALDHSPADLHVYVLDFGGRSLKILEPLPHVGGVLLPDESERLERLLRMLFAQMDRRKDLLAASGAGTLAAHRAQSSDAPPAILVVLDNYAEFSLAYPEHADSLARVTREGGSLGIHVVVTANAPAAIPYRLGGNLALAVALELNDPTDYGLVVGRTGGLLPERGVRGRGLVKRLPPLEFQTALAVDGASDGERARAVRTLVAAMSGTWSGPRPPAVPVLPDVIPLAKLLLPSERSGPDLARSTAVPIGLDAVTLDPVRVDLTEGPHFLITGPHGSGKTTLLQGWLLALADALPPDRLMINLVGLGGVSLLPLARLPHAATYVDEDAGLAELLADLRARVDERREVLDRARRAADGLLDDREVLQELPAIVLALDDFDQVRASASEANKSALEALLRRGRGLGVHVLVAGPISEFASGWDAVTKAIKEGQSGVLLGSSDHGDLGVFGLRLPSGEAGKVLPPGRGFLARRTRHRALQCATCHEGEPTLGPWIRRIAERQAGEPPLAS